MSMDGETLVVSFMGLLLVAVLALGPLGRAVRAAAVDAAEYPAVREFLASRSMLERRESRAHEREDVVRRRESGVPNVDDGAAHAPSPSAPPPSPPSGEGGFVCSVCLEEPPRAPVETNCAHVFCAECLDGYWQHSFRPQPCRCPVCRRDVTLVQLASAAAGPSTPESEEFVRTYNRVVGSRPTGVMATATSAVQDAPWLLRRLFTDHTLFATLGSLWCVAFMLPPLLAVTYALVPVDLVPDPTFLGVADDIIAIVVALVFVAEIYRRYQIAQAQGA
jgi:RING finger protein 170